LITIYFKVTIISTNGRVRGIGESNSNQPSLLDDHTAMSHDNAGYRIRVATLIAEHFYRCHIRTPYRKSRVSLRQRIT